MYSLKKTQVIMLAIALLLSSLTLVSTAQFNAEKEPFIIKSFSDVSFQKISAQTTHGNIVVSNVPAAEARIEVYVRANNGIDRNLSREVLQQRLEENYSLNMAVADGQLTTVAKRKNMLDIGKRSLSISITIFTPQNVSTVLRTDHGNISVSGLTGEQKIVTSHGDLTLADLKGGLTGETSHGNISMSGSTDDIALTTDHGNIDIKKCSGVLKLGTSHGNVHINGLEGKVRARTDHGDVNGETVKGELTASTSHGNVDFKSLSCSVDASTSHGNINVFLDELVGPVTANNPGGDIAVLIPKGKGIDVDLKGKSIKMDPLMNFSGSKENRSMKGTLNGGGSVVKATAGKGTINLDFR